MSANTRRALVTGASAGIGLSCVKKLAKAGYQVYGCARNIKAIEVCSDPSQLDFIPGFE